MNAVHLTGFLVFSIALLLYIFANFRLTRLLNGESPKGKIREAIAYISCIVLGEVIILYQLCHAQYLLWVFISVFVCHFPILFLYEPSLRKNTLTLLKLFGGDLVYIVIWILAEGSFDNTDHELLFLTLCGAKLVLTLLAESYYRRCEKERISHQMELYSHQMKLMEQSQAQIRFLRHDMKNHLLHIQHLLMEHDDERLKNYLQETTARLSVSNEFVRSGNRDIDSLLNYKLLIAKQLGTEIKTDIAIPSDLNISSFDVNVILGNLLDNAIEALQNCKERRLLISLRYDAGILSILLQNTCIQKPPAFSVKGQGHGLGLHSVRHALEHYHGQLKTDYQEHIFTASALLYLGHL